MADPVEALLLDLVEWVSRRPRPYPEVMDAWRTSCPRLPVWEEAMDRGLLAQDAVSCGPAMVRATAAGSRYLHHHGRITGESTAIAAMERR